MPSVVSNLDAFKAKGVDTVAVTTVNDPFVMTAWQNAIGTDKVEFLADGNAEFAKAIDLTLDGTAHRPWHPLQALFDAGRRRRRQDS